MTKKERYFDKLMKDYYHVLIHAWNAQTKEAARMAIKELVKLNDAQRNDPAFLQDLEYVIKQKMGDGFAEAVAEPTHKFTEACYKINAFSNRSIDFKMYFTPTDAKNIEMINKQNMFWIRDHYKDTQGVKLNDLVAQGIEQNLTHKQMAEQLQHHFGDTIKGGRVYFEGLASHTALRVNGFGELATLHRLGFDTYKFVAVIDDRTSEICRALDGKIFKVNKSYDIMEAILDTS